MNAVQEKAALAAWKGHNRKPVQQSIKRLNHRRQRRRTQAIARRRVAELASVTR